MQKRLNIRVLNNLHRRRIQQQVINIISLITLQTKHLIKPSRVVHRVRNGQVIIIFKDKQVGTQRVVTMRRRNSQLISNIRLVGRINNHLINRDHALLVNFSKLLLVILREDIHDKFNLRVIILVPVIM